MLDKMRTLPQITDVAQRPAVERAAAQDHHQPRPGVALRHLSRRLIDDTLNDAFGQRQITQYFTQLKTYFVVLEILPELQKDLSTLDRLYVKSPLTGGAVPLSIAGRRRHQQGRPAFGVAPGPVPGGDADVQPAARRGARRRRSTRSTTPRARSSMPSSIIGDLPGQRAGVPELAVQRADPDRARR